MLCFFLWCCPAPSYGESSLRYGAHIGPCRALSAPIGPIGPNGPPAP